MIVERARQDALSFAAGLVVALVWLVSWPGRMSTDQDLVLLTGVLVAGMVSWAVDLAVWKHRPELLGGNARPARFQVLLFAGGFVAMMTYFTLRDRAVADRGVIAFVVFVVLVGVTGLVANYRWAVASSDHDARVTGASGTS
jgi:hypothetical protein